MKHVEADSSEERASWSPLRKFRDRLAAEKNAIRLHKPVLAAKLDIRVDEAEPKPDRRNVSNR